MPPLTCSCAASAAADPQQPPTMPPPPPVNLTTIFTIPEQPEQGDSDMSHLGLHFSHPADVYRTHMEGRDLSPHFLSVPTEPLSNPFCRILPQVTPADCE